MFKYFFRKKTEEALRKGSAKKPQAVASDVCKRAIGMFPDSVSREPDFKDTVTLRFHHLLISLEGAERTGCLKISSHLARSRSALLLFRGRVVGAVYGRKYMRGQYLHQDAHRCALADLATPGNLLDAYELPEDLVLAAASLFYGETLQLNMGQPVEAIFDSALGSLIRSGMPGCVIVNSYTEETVCIVYVSNGRVVGMFSATEGWTRGTPDVLKRQIAGRQCKVHAAILPLTDARSVGFSLSGIGDLAPNASFDATPYMDFTPAPSATVMTPSREAVAQAVRQHRNTRGHVRAARAYAQVS